MSKAIEQREDSDEFVSDDRRSPERKRMLRGAVFVFISAVCWGFSGTCVEFLTAHLGVAVDWINFWRMLVSGLALVVFCLVSGRRRLALGRMIRDPRARRGVLIYAIFGVFACQHCYLESISYTNAGIATMMEQIGLVIVVMWECARLRRAPRIRELLGLLLALAGMFCICTQGTLELTMSREGLFWGVASMFAMACYIMLPVGLTKKWDSIVISAPAMMIAALAGLVLLKPWTCAPPELSFPIIGAMAGVIVLGTLAAYLCFLEGIKDAGPVIAGLLDTAEPVAAVAFSAIWLGTAITAWDGAGCVLILIMMVLITI